MCVAKFGSRAACVPCDAHGPALGQRAPPAQAVLAAAGVPDSEGGGFKLRYTFALRQLRRGTAPEQVAPWLSPPDAAELARYRRVLLVPVEVV
jgi:hypothetical protein